MKSETSALEFVGLKNLALLGISDNPKKFGNTIYKSLKKSGYNVSLVHPTLDAFSGDKCYRDLKSIPDKVDGVVFVVHPEKVVDTLKQANDMGIKNVWLQQGAQSQKAIEYCKENNINSVNGECILMYTDGDKFPHNFHRWIWKTIGKYPKSN